MLCSLLGALLDSLANISEYQSSRPVSYGSVLSIESQRFSCCILFVPRGLRHFDLTTVITTDVLAQTDAPGSRTLNHGAIANDVG